jgi:hypothetical protein
MLSRPVSRKRLIVTGVLVVLTIGLAACASQPPGQTGAPAFLAGLWHGVIAPIAFVISLFDNDVRMYAFPNAGRWYDFGFLLGIGVWGGGAGAGAARR